MCPFLALPPSGSRGAPLGAGLTFSDPWQCLQAAGRAHSSPWNVAPKGSGRNDGRCSLQASGCAHPAPGPEWRCCRGRSERCVSGADEIFSPSCWFFFFPYLFLKDFNLFTLRATRGRGREWERENPNQTLQSPIPQP